MSEKTVRPQQQPLRFSRVEPACRPIEIHVEPERVTADDRHREGWIGPIRWRTDETSAELLERLCQSLFELCMPKRVPTDNGLERKGAAGHARR